MVKTVLICGGYAQFQSKTKDFIKNGNGETEIKTFDLTKNLSDLPECDHLIIYRERNINLENILKDLDINKEVILVGNIRREDKILAHDFGVKDFIYIPECGGNQLDPYIREIEKSITPNGDLLGY